MSRSLYSKIAFMKNRYEILRDMGCCGSIFWSSTLPLFFTWSSYATVVQFWVVAKLNILNCNPYKVDSVDGLWTVGQWCRCSTCSEWGHDLLKDQIHSVGGVDSGKEALFTCWSYYTKPIPHLIRKNLISIIHALMTSRLDCSAWCMKLPLTKCSEIMKTMEWNREGFKFLFFSYKVYCTNMTWTSGLPPGFWPLCHLLLELEYL